MKKKSVLPLRPLRLCGEDFSAGFSLIEVLVSMAVLIVIIVMVTNMFRNASEAWDTGTQRAEMNTAARCAVEYIARELSCAVAGSMPDSAGATITLKKFELRQNVYDMTTNLSFVALSGDDHTLRGIRFRYNNKKIEACRFTDSFSDPYHTADPDWPDWLGVAPLITNVWRFQVIAYAKENDMNVGNSLFSYDSTDAANNNSLPACVDISLEMLGERDMARALSLSDVPAGSSPQEGYVMTNSRVYTTRVCFPNRGGR